MKCENFAMAFESQSAWKRWRAGQHARNCPHCAATALVISELTQELRRVEPLPAALRNVWERAAEDTVVRPAPIPNRVHWEFPAMAAAALIIVVGLLAWSARPTVVVPGEKVVRDDGDSGNHALPALARPSGAAKELNDLLAQVDALEQEVKGAMRQAELLDARHQADRMISTYNRW